MVARRLRVRTVLVLVLVATPARAIMIRGHGSPDAECLVGVDVEGRRTGATFADVVRRGSRVVQRSCGRHCQFNLRLAQNLLGCAPGKLRDLFVIGDTDGKILDRPPLGVATHGTASHFDSLTLDLGAKRRRVSRRLTFLGVARDGRRDEDVVTLVCERSTQSCCGNGVLDSGEECDDGNLDDDTTCDSNCTVPECGNGIMDHGEECDDGNRGDGDGCDHNCTTTRCGNGVVTAGEACEPGVAGTCACGSYCDENCDCVDQHPCLCAGQSGTLPENGLLTFHSAGFGGVCGELVPAQDSPMLVCGGLYFGGSAKGQVAAAVALDPTLTMTMAATCSDTHVSLAAVGMPDGCSQQGCLLGKPVPLPEDVKACLVLSLTDNARGTVECGTGAVSLDLSVLAEVYDDPCPVCGTRRDDCDTGGRSPIISVRAVPVKLSTASAIATADAGGVFCGFCRAQEDGAFKGENQTGAPVACSCGSGLPGCHAADACPSEFPVCGQEQPGAFNQDKAVEIHLAGLAPERLGSVSMPARMSAAFCVPPIQQDQIDLLVSVPGPGALTFAGDLRLDALPPPPCP